VACNQPRVYTPTQTPKIVPPTNWVLVGFVIIVVILLLGILGYFGFVIIKKIKNNIEVNKTHYTSLWLINDSDGSQKIPLMKLDNMLDDEYEEDAPIEVIKTEEPESKLVATSAYEEETSY